MSASFPIALLRCPDYAPARLADAVDAAFTACGYTPKPGDRILLKPNLLTARPALACSEPALVAAVAAWLHDHGCAPSLADSPGFGSAEAVCRAVGITQAVSSLARPIPIQAFDASLRLPLRQGGHIAIAKAALEADALINLPRLKAHKQLRITAGVKNLFGCVGSFRKALAHARHGDRGTAFESMLLDIALALPARVTLLDAISAMHRTGPMQGDPLPLGLLAAAGDPIALDTALYAMLRLTPADIPLWAEADRRRLPAADPTNLAYPLAQPHEFDLSAFEVPDDLSPVSFRPATLARSLFRRLKAKVV